MTAAEKYAETARLAGCPRDLITNLIRGGACLLPHQLAASAAARECDVEGGPTDVLFGGARGPGKSHWSLVQVAIDDCQRCPGLKVLFLRKVGKAARESIEDLRSRILMQIPHNYRRQEGIIEFPNGSRIILGHFKSEGDIDSYLGLEYDVIVIEESGTISPQKHKAINTCLRTSKPNWRPRRYHTTNPGGVAHTYLKNLFITPWRQESETTTRFIPATYRQNLFLNKEYVNELERLVGWQRKAWLDGDWDVAAGQYFSNFSYERVVIKPFPLEAGWRKWLAMDYGFTHPNASGLFAMDGDGNRYLVAERLERKKLVEYHAKEIKDMLAGFDLELWQLSRLVAGADIFSKRADSAGLTIADQYKAQGINFEKADDNRIGGAGEILNLIGDESEGMPGRLFIFDTCVKTIEAIPAMIHNQNRPEDVLKVDADEDGEGGDDAYDMLRYGLMAAKDGSWLQNPRDLAKLVASR